MKRTLDMLQSQIWRNIGIFCIDNVQINIRKIFFLFYFLLVLLLFLFYALICLQSYKLAS